MDSGSIHTLALRLARLAGAAVEERKARSRSRTAKGSNDFVTDADRVASFAIVAGIREACPDHGILCEDLSLDDHEDARLVWIVDPLDGTTNFMHGYPAYCVSICCYDRETDAPVASAVYEPVTGRSFSAIEDQDAFLNGTSIRVTERTDLEDCLVLAGMSHKVDDDSPEIQAFTHLSACTAGTRRSGCAALDLCFVAAGFADAYFHQNLEVWDTAAGAHIVRNAGGRVTNIGSDSFSPSRKSVLATNGAIHEALGHAIESSRRALA